LGGGWRVDFDVPTHTGTVPKSNGPAITGFTYRQAKRGTGIYTRARTYTRPHAGDHTGGNTERVVEQTHNQVLVTYRHCPMEATHDLRRNLLSGTRRTRPAEPAEHALYEGRHTHATHDTHRLGRDTRSGHPGIRDPQCLRAAPSKSWRDRDIHRRCTESSACLPLAAS